MREQGTHDVYVTVHTFENEAALEAEATMDVRHYPDGSSVANGLDANALRDVAQMLNDVADDMEEL